jgi:nicotinate-nucleotide pyrophosphorylase (carboxylating)
LTSFRVPPLLPQLYAPAIERALEEDLGIAGDLTTDAIAGPDDRAEAVIAMRTAGRVAGLDVAVAVFRKLDGGVGLAIEAGDGSDGQVGQVLARISGLARPILIAERTALNFLGRLCGIATATRDMVAAVAGTRTAIVCTRKTTPGLRVLEKYAVRVGGGMNHRFGLDDAVLIKDNHIAVAGGVREAVARVRRGVGHLVKVEVEVDSFDQLEELLRDPVDAVLLDNMTPEQLKKAVAMIGGRMIAEASGGVTPQNVRAVAQSGVDLVSLGWLTHSVPALDVGLDFSLR